MVLEKREEVKKIFEDFLDDSLLRIILSSLAPSYTAELFLITPLFFTTILPCSIKFSPFLFILRLIR